MKRSGRWQLGYSLGLDGVEEAQAPQDDDEYTDPELGLTDGSVSANDKSSASDDEVLQACSGMTRRVTGPAIGLNTFFRHKTTKTFHRLGQADNLACGRKCATCDKVDDEAIIFPKCKVCFGNSVADN